MEKLTNGAKMLNAVVDLTPNSGVSYFLKYAVLGAAKDKGISLEFRQSPVAGTRGSFQRLIKFNSFFDFVLNVLDLFRMFIFSLKIAPLFALNRKRLIFSLLSLTKEEIVIGDCILSAYQRNNKTRVTLGRNIELFLFVVASYFSIIVNIRRLAVEIKKDGGAKYFFCHETTGIEETLRRYCIVRGMIEIRYSKHHKGFRLFSGFDGVALRKQEKFNLQAGQAIEEAEIQVAKEKLSSLVDRTVQYAYLKSVDVDLNVTLSCSPKAPKTTVVIFLATLSDAQYLYGVGPYPSLDTFQESLLEFFLAKDMNVVVKPHPAMMKNKDYAEKDRSYYRSLLRKWDAQDDDEYVKRSSLNNKLIFVSEKLSVKELSKKFPSFLCVTQHGSVAAECAHLGHLSLVGKNSQFSEQDKFVEILEDADELQEKLDRWLAFTAFTKSEIHSIYRYIYIHNFFNVDLYGNIIFSDLIPKDLETSEIENWLKEFLDNNPDAEYKLNQSAKLNISKLNNNFEEVIAYEK
ncbi:hypothetical protein [Thalassospira sp. HJ]|uniref:hypothetical protein n=1 Tax=Thalassospira sp. HJ TaxID=1616823 RepID=UPI00126A25C2|nr:hypothetical protein [Thalassospira sp. HJ]